MNFCKMAYLLVASLFIVACSDDECVDDSGQDIVEETNDTDETSDTDTGITVTDPVDTGDTAATDTGSNSSTTE